MTTGAVHARLALVFGGVRVDTVAATLGDAAAAAWARDAAQRSEWAERLTAAGLSSPPR